MPNRIIIGYLMLALCIVGCAQPTPRSVTAWTPMPAWTATAITPTSTLTPTATLPPATFTPQPSPTPTATTASPTPTLGAALSSPAVVEEIALWELPGIGHSPSAMAFLDGRLYVANWATSNLSIIEGQKVVAVVPVGMNPAALWADPAQGLIYVANQGEDSISVIAGDRVVRTLRVGGGPAALASVAGQLVVGSSSRAKLALVDSDSGTSLQEVSLLDQPIGVLSLALDADSGLLFVNLYGETYVAEARSLKPRYKVSLNSYITLVASPHLGRFYVNDYDVQENQQYLVAVRSADGVVLGRVPIGGDPRGAAVNARTGRIYVANSWTNDVTVIQEEPYKVLGTILVGKRPVAVAVDEETNRIYVANADSDNVVVIDGETNRVVAVIPLAIIPQGIAADDRSGRAYVANPSTNSVFVLEKGRVIREIAVGLHPVAIGHDAKADLLYVTNEVEGTASVIALDKGQVVQTVAVGERPKAVAANRVTGRVYIGDLILDGATRQTLGKLSFPETATGFEIKPQMMEVDPLTNRLYVVAFNGTPGFNGGDIIYVLDGESGKPLEARLGGLSTIGMALDLAEHRLYSVAGRLGIYALYVNDLESYAEIERVELGKQPRSLAYNPTTHHLFLGLIEGQQPGTKPGREIRVLDSRDLREVASLPFAGEPAAMAVDTIAKRVYVSDPMRGQVVVIQDTARP